MKRNTTLLLAVAAALCSCQNTEVQPRALIIGATPATPAVQEDIPAPTPAPAAEAPASPSASVSQKRPVVSAPTVSQRRPETRPTATVLQSGQSQQARRTSPVSQKCPIILPAQRVASGVRN